MDIGPMHPDLNPFVYSGRMISFWDFRGGHQNSNDMLLDLTRNGHDLTVVGAVPRIPGYGANFINNPANALTTPDDPDFTPNRGYLVVARINLIATGANQVIFGHGGGNAVVGSWSLTVENATRKVRSVHMDGGAVTAASSAGTINWAQVHIIAAYWTNPNVRFFIDNAFDSTVALARIPRNSNLLPNIGRLSTGVLPAGGSISVITFLNDNFTDAEVIRIMQCVGMTGCCPYSFWEENQGRNRTTP